MVIDTYNNVWRAAEEGASAYLTSETYSVEMMLEDMDAGGVDMAVGCSLGQKTDNEYLAEVMQKYPRRIIGFGQVNPRQPDAVQVVRRCMEEYGLKGLKLHPTMHGYHFVDHPLLDPIFEVMSDYKLPVLVNALDDPFVTPLGIEEIARNFPDVPVLIAHMGTVWNVVEALLVAGRNDNIYLETSATMLLDVRMAYRQVGARRMVMGTDWPAADFELERLKLRKGIPNEDDLQLVEGENMRRLLRLDEWFQ
ncbi:MAG: amidohydrolase family protein [Ardenticatenaceae bacterium]|nr:amidohydrolase family protein [Ardenticatenaceae bacterium]HBY97660.1 amidohydrolase [Chloroflexota bacterium]